MRAFNYRAAYDNIDKVLSKYAYEDEWSLDEFIAELRSHEVALGICHKLLEYEMDDRPGEETYGYKDDEDIKHNIHYIADRWNCQFRLRWLIDLLKQER